MVSIDKKYTFSFITRMLKSKIPLYLVSCFAFQVTVSVLLSFAYFSEVTMRNKQYNNEIRTFCISMGFCIYSSCAILCLGFICNKALSELPLLKYFQVFSSQEMNEPVSGKCWNKAKKIHMESSAEGSAYIFDKGSFDLVQFVLPLLTEMYCSQVMRAPWEHRFSNWDIKD